MKIVFKDAEVGAKSSQPPGGSQVLPAFSSSRLVGRLNAMAAKGSVPSPLTVPAVLVALMLFGFHSWDRNFLENSGLCH